MIEIAWYIIMVCMVVLWVHEIGWLKMPLLTTYIPVGRRNLFFLWAYGLQFALMSLIEVSIFMHRINNV